MVGVCGPRERWHALPAAQGALGRGAGSARGLRALRGLVLVCLASILVASASLAAAPPGAMRFVRARSTSAQHEQALARIREARAATTAGDVRGGRELAEGAIELLAGDAAEDAASRSRLLLEAGLVAFECGSIRSAERAWTLAMEARSPPPGSEPTLGWLEARMLVARARGALGDLHGARAMQLEAVAAYERLLPAAHETSLLAGLELAETLRECGELDEARSRLEALIPILQQILPAGDRVLWKARLSQASVLQDLGDLRAAHAIREQVVRLLEESVPEEDPELASARISLAVSKHGLGELAGARSLLEAVLEVYERTLPEEHPSRLLAESNLAATLKPLGELERASELEAHVLSVYRRLLPAAHPDLLRLTSNHAGTLFRQGRMLEALRLQRDVLDLLAEGQPPEHSLALHARHNLACILDGMKEYGAARALFEEVLELRRRSLGETHPDTLLVKENLARVLMNLGEPAPAQALFDEVETEYATKLGAEHPYVIQLRIARTMAMRDMGDLTGALASLEELLERRGQVLSPEHGAILDLQQRKASVLGLMNRWEDALEVQEAVVRAREQDSERRGLASSRQALATILQQLGRLSEALEIQEAAVAEYVAALPAGDPKLVSARQSLANTLAEAGHLERALRLQEEVLEFRRLLPPGSTDLVHSLCNAALLYHDLGRTTDRDAALVELVRGMVERIRDVGGLSAREIREIVEAEDHRLSVILSLTRDSSEADALRQAVFALIESHRRASLCQPLRTLGSAGEAEAIALRWEAMQARQRVSDLVRGLGSEPEPETQREIERLSAERDRLERRLRGIGAGERASPLDVASLAEELEAGSALVAYRAYDAWEMSEGQGRATFLGSRLLAHVLRPEGTLLRIELGPTPRINALVSRWREAIGEPVNDARGVAVGLSRGPGSGPGATREIGEELRRALLDPVLAAAGEAELLYLCPDGPLHAVPVEALPLGDGLVGDRHSVLYRTSVGATDARTRPAGSQPDLLVLGSVDYDFVPGIGGGADTQPDTSDAQARQGQPQSSFASLPETNPEIEVVSRLFVERFERRPTELKGRTATKRNLLEASGGKRYLHLATHGWSSVGGAAGARGPDGTVPAVPRSIYEEQASSFAPLAFCGLALAGANRDRDEAGRPAGILTAEELAGLDLSQCELAVLSACDTHVGASWAGQGVQSLQAALHQAGARSSITSLWRVDDEATRLLMSEFYRLFWSEGRTKLEALWRAKAWLRSLEWSELESLRSGAPEESRAGSRRQPGTAPDGDSRLSTERPFEEHRFWAGWILAGEQR